MEDEPGVTRRTILGTGAVAAAALAGCTGEDEPDSEADSDGSSTETATATATETPTAPTLETFEYPEGASVDGVENGVLGRTHRTAITDAGSVTVELSERRDHGQFTEATTATKRWGEAGVSVTTEGDVTETLWSPAAEHAGYVRMDTGFEQRYRIDNDAPSPRQVTEVSRFEGVVDGVEWGEAVEVVEDAGGDYAVRYEGSGVADRTALRGVVFGEVTEVEATIAVSQAGHVSEIAYDLTAERDHGTVEVSAEATATAVGETDLEAPEWFGTAREEGTRFEMRLVEGGEVIELELVNGPELPREAIVQASADGLFARSPLPEAVSVGDRVYLAFAGEDDLRVTVDGTPEESTPLEGFVRAVVELDQFTLFEGTVRQ